MRKQLSGCEKCGDVSVVRRAYYCKRDGKMRRVAYCINKGCGWRREILSYDDMRDEVSKSR